MNHPKVSIIVPVYNVEAYIIKCLDSIKSQSFRDFECLIIDDGSPDKSIDRAKKKIKGDNRFKIFTKKNGGLSSARNYGLRLAQGKYVSFVDSDDWIEKDMIKELFESAVEHQSDFVFCSLYVDYENGQTKELIKEGINYPTSFNSVQFPDLFVDIGCYACNKLYRKMLFKEHDIFFPERLYYEDIATFPRLFVHSSKVSRVEKPLYHYLYRESSITGAFSILKFDHYFDAVEIVNQYLKNDPKFQAYQNALHWFNALNLFYLPSAYSYYLKGKGEREYATKKIREQLKKYVVSKKDVLMLKRNQKFYLLSNGVKKAVFFIIFLWAPKTFYKIASKFDLL